MGYGITDPSQLIDVGTIVSCCEEMRENLPGFKSIGGTITDAGDVCDEKALSINGESMGPSIENYGIEVQCFENVFNSALDQVCSSAQAIYREQLAELEAYQEQQRLEYLKAEEGKSHVSSPL